MISAAARIKKPSSSRTAMDVFDSLRSEMLLARKKRMSTSALPRGGLLAAMSELSPAASSPVLLRSPR